MKILEFMVRNQILSWENPCQGVTENTRGVLRVAFETDSEWDGMARTAVFQHGMNEPVMVPVTEETVLIPPEVIVAGELRVGLVGLGSGGTVQIPTRWMNKPIIIQPSTPVTGKGPEAIAPEAWEKALASIGNLSDLNTEAKNNLVAAINEVLQTGGIPGANGREVELSVVDSCIVWRYVGESAWRNLIALSDLKGDSGRGVKSIAGSADGSWTITYTDNTTENVSSAAYAALKATVDKAVLTDAMSLTVAQQAQVRTNIAAAAAADLANYYRKSETYSQSEINAKISAIPKFSIAPVTTLPANGISATTLYLVITNSADNLYMEYIFVPTNSAATGPFTDSQGRWEPLGAQTVDLTGYATEAWANLTFQPIGSYVTEEKFESLSKSVSELSSQKVTAPAKAQIGQTIAVKSIDETGKPIEWEAVDMTSGSGEAAAIIDVIELPTENINEDVFYRLLTGVFVKNGLLRNDVTCYCVDGLPEVGEPVTMDFKTFITYYSTADGACCGYVDTRVSAALGVPVGWYPIGNLLYVVGETWGGVITDIKEDPSDGANRLLLSESVYRYRDGWYLANIKETAIIDVVELPAMNAIPGVFYRLVAGTLVQNREEKDWVVCRCVEELPAVGQSENEDGIVQVYYNLSDKTLYFYASGGHAEYLGVPDGWATVETVAPMLLESEYKGVITNFADSPTDDAFRLLLEYKLYHYQNDWHSVTGIGYAGTGECSEVFNYRQNTASGLYSHAEGLKTVASGNYSHAEGFDTVASGSHSHAEGHGTAAQGPNSHAEGSGTVASGEYSHAEGSGTVALGNYSHAEGHNTIANGNSQHVQGSYNIEDTQGKYAHIVGNGKSDTNRSNAHTLDWNGNAWFAGNIEGTALTLKSPNGRRFQITVSDDGTLSAATIG